MELKKIDYKLTVCKVTDASSINTDYILVKENNYERALTIFILASEGYTVI